MTVSDGRKVSLRGAQSSHYQREGELLFTVVAQGGPGANGPVCRESLPYPILFQPGAAEVHAQAGKWFDDREIYEWFAANLHRIREPSMRHYVRAKELKAAGIDWTDVLAVEDENPRARLAAEVLASGDYSSTAARVKAFVDRGGGCRATFFNYRRKLGEANGGA